MTKYKSMIAMAMGGKVAEELVFGPENVTSGAVQRHPAGQPDRPGDGDASSACPTSSATSTMPATQVSYLGNQSAVQRLGTRPSELIDREVRRLVDEGYERAKRILTENCDELENLAQGLLEYETLTGKDIMRVIRGEAPRKGEDDG